MVVLAPGQLASAGSRYTVLGGCQRLAAPYKSKQVRLAQVRPGTTPRGVGAVKVARTVKNLSILFISSSQLIHFQPLRLLPSCEGLPETGEREGIFVLPNCIIGSRYHEKRVVHAMLALIIGIVRCLFTISPDRIKRE